jgi:hypothetical protein
MPSCFSLVFSHGKRAVRETGCHKTVKADRSRRFGMEVAQPKGE